MASMRTTNCQFRCTIMQSPPWMSRYCHQIMCTISQESVEGGHCPPSASFSCRLRQVRGKLHGQARIGWTPTVERGELVAEHPWDDRPVGAQRQVDLSLKGLLQGLSGPLLLAARIPHGPKHAKVGGAILAGNLPGAREQ